MPALIAEGELDALVAIRRVGCMVNVVTTGGTGPGPCPALVAASG